MHYVILKLLEIILLFPLLTVAVFVALHISRQMVFYEKQRSRGDIQAIPEALCEPGKEGKPLVMDYDGKLHTLDESDYDYETDSDDDSDTLNTEGNFTLVNQDDIEANFLLENNNSKFPSPTLKTVKAISKPSVQLPVESSVLNNPASGLIPAAKSTTLNSSSPRIVCIEKRKKSKRKKKKRLENLDKLLNGPIQSSTNTKKIPPSNNLGKEKKSSNRHRRTQSEPFILEDAMSDSSSSGCNSTKIWKKPVLKRVDSYGEVSQGQPSLMDQARRRAASFAKTDGMKKKP
jgi:hypothetical protein